MTIQFSHNLPQSKGRQAIKNWVYQRNNLLVSWYASAGLPVNDHQLQSPPAPSTNKLKQQLIDYTSAAHFQLYSTILEHAQAQGQNKQSQFEKLYPQLVNLTMEALDFSENDILNQEQISRIGENIATRFELEDQLLRDLQL